MVGVSTSKSSEVVDLTRRSKPSRAVDLTTSPNAISTSTSLLNASDSRSDRDLIRCSLVCQSNVNRSMEAHALLAKQSWAIDDPIATPQSTSLPTKSISPSIHMLLSSYGTGSKVRMPGEAANQPNIYPFNTTTYNEIVNDLTNKNVTRYTANGIIPMLKRDALVKSSPQRWQSRTQDIHSNLIITFEQRVYEAILLDCNTRKQLNCQFRQAHLINIDTTDNHEQAYESSLLTLKLCQAIVDSIKSTTKQSMNDVEIVDDTYSSIDEPTNQATWSDEIESILDDFEEKNNKQLLHTVIFY